MTPIEESERYIPQSNGIYLTTTYKLESHIILVFDDLLPLNPAESSKINRQMPNSSLAEEILVEY